MGKKGKGTQEFKLDCDDGMFMQSHIIIQFNPNDPLEGIHMEMDYQCGYGPAYLRKGEIKDLIDTLTKIHEQIKD